MLRELLFTFLLTLAQLVGTKHWRMSGTREKHTMEYEALGAYLLIHYDGEAESARRMLAIAAIRKTCNAK